MAGEYEAFCPSPITSRYAWVWADGIYLGVGLGKEHSCLLVGIGAREDGHKELLAMELGHCESIESRAGVLRGLRERAMVAPLLAVGVGALGLWAGLREVYPGVRLRTTVAKRAPARENALYLVFKIVERLAMYWRQLNGGATIMTLLLAGAVFRGGVLVEHPAKREETPRRPDQQDFTTRRKGRFRHVLTRAPHIRSSASTRTTSMFVMCARCGANCAART